jgi:hypothetical protein
VNNGKNFPSLRTLSAVRHADSSTKFVCASQQAEHRPPWSAEPWAIRKKFLAFGLNTITNAGSGRACDIWYRSKSWTYLHTLCVKYCL